MPETQSLLLPINLVGDKKFINKSIYASDYCMRRRRIPERRHVKTKETPIYATDAFSPTTRFYNDHFQTTSHKQLKNHCQKILNTIERSSSRKGFYDNKPVVYDGIQTIPPYEDNDQPLVDVLPMSLRRIESEWQKEAHTTKRERADIYGRAGTKKWFDEREKEDTSLRKKNQKLIPGLSKWLNEANENEKIAVHKFMKNVSDTINTEREPKPHIDDSGNHLASHSPKIEGYLDYIPDQNEEMEQLEPVSQLPPLDDEADITTVPQLNEILDAPLSHEQILDETEATKQVIFRSPTYTTDHDNFLATQKYSTPPISPGHKDISFSSTQMAQNGYSNDQRPQSAGSFPVAASPLHNLRRPNSSLGIPTHNQRSNNYNSFNPPRPKTRAFSRERNAGKSHHHLPYSNCDSCEGIEVRKMANRLAGMKPESYKSLKDEMKRRPQMAISKMYKSSAKDYDHIPEDFVYTYSIFGNATSNGKGHFTIHPEWVSERIKPRKSFR